MFIGDTLRNKAVSMCPAWWIAILRDTTPQIKTARRGSARTILIESVLLSQS